MCTETESPGAMSPNAQANVWLATLPVIEQVPGPAYAGSMLQSTPLPEGSGSSSMTALAVPVPSETALLTVTVNPIGSPALTGVASAVLVIDRSGQSTVVLADAWT